MTPVQRLTGDFMTSRDIGQRKRLGTVINKLSLTIFNFCESTELFCWKSSRAAEEDEEEQKKRAAKGGFKKREKQSQSFDDASKRYFFLVIFFILLYSTALVFGQRGSYYFKLFLFEC